MVLHTGRHRPRQQPLEPASLPPPRQGCARGVRAARGGPRLLRARARPEPPAARPALRRAAAAAAATDEDWTTVGGGGGDIFDAER